MFISCKTSQWCSDHRLPLPPLSYWLWWHLWFWVGWGSLLDRCVLRSDQALICRLPQTDTSYKVINHLKTLLWLPASFKVVFFSFLQRSPCPPFVRQLKNVIRFQNKGITFGKWGMSACGEVILKSLVLINNTVSSLLDWWWSSRAWEPVKILVIAL